MFCRFKCLLVAFVRKLANFCRLQIYLIFTLSFFLHNLDLRTAFDLLDRNQDGLVTANELQFMLTNMGINVRDELIDEIIKQASQNGRMQN